MSDSQLLPSPRHKFFAFSAVGVAMVCVPLVQVLRYQHDDLRQLDADRKLLDPVSQAVHAQFGILAHQQVSYDLLTGQPQLESTRAAVQAGVDQQLQALSAELTQGMWIHALTEARDLRQDWQTLARQVAALALTPQASNEAHTLRVEQMLQVMDLLSLPSEFENLSANPTSRTGVKSANTGLITGVRALMRLARSLPQAEAMAVLNTDQSAADGPSGPTPRMLALQHALAPGASATATAVPALADVVAAVERTARQVVTTAKQASDNNNVQAQPLRRAALQQAWDAQQALFDRAVALRTQSLAQQRTKIEQQRLAMLAVLAALAAVALVLARAALRPRRADHAAARVDAPDTGDAAPPSHPAVETGRVLDRLRSPRHAPDAAPDTSKRQPADTQSPPA